MKIEPNSADPQSIVKIQSDQFIFSPISANQSIYSDSHEYEVDLARQSCQCNSFLSHRVEFPIGDPRRFCRHLVEARSSHLDDLHPFIQTLLDARASQGAGMPNGASFAFFEVDGRLGFLGENRDQTAYFFVSGKGANVFHEFIYDRKNKQWIGNRPDAPDALLGFAFKERGHYVTNPQIDPTNVSRNDSARSRRKRSRRKGRENQNETSSFTKYLVLVLVSIGLAAGGYYLFANGTPEWLAKLTGTEIGSTDPEGTSLPSKQDQIETQKKIQSPPRKPDDEVKVENLDDVQKSKESNATPRDAPSVEQPKAPTEDDRPEELPFRTWNTLDQKFAVSARYKSYMNGQVTLIREDNGNKVEIDVDQLSTADQEYVKQIRRERRLQKAKNTSRAKSE